MSSAKKGGKLDELPSGGKKSELCEFGLELFVIVKANYVDCVHFFRS